MKERNEQQLKAMMKEMKVSNRNYYLLKEKKVQNIQIKIDKMIDKIKVS